MKTKFVKISSSISSLFWIITAIFTIYLCNPIFSQVSFETFILSDNTHGSQSLFLCDLDNDLDVDILCATSETSDIRWWENDGNNPPEFEMHIIGSNFWGAGTVHAADLNNDTYLDVIGGAKAGDQIAWWENDPANPGNFTKYVIINGYNFPHEVYTHDLDQDGYVDVLAASSLEDEIAWWKNDGGSPISWEKQIIGSGFVQAKSVHVGDFDGDGLLDVVGASLLDHEVTWWRNNGGNPIQWEENVITSTFNGSHRVQVIDINQDGSDDILGTAWYAHDIAWWENEGG